MASKLLGLIMIMKQGFAPPVVTPRALELWVPQWLLLIFRVKTCFLSSARMSYPTTAVIIHYKSSGVWSLISNIKLDIYVSSPKGSIFRLLILH